MAGTQRKKTSTTRKKKTGKVYIPPYKAIILCLSVIVVCVVLLLVSTISKPKTPSKKEADSQTSITERFEEETEEKQNEKKASPEIPKKEEPKVVTKSEKKVEDKKEKTENKDTAGEKIPGSSQGMTDGPSTELRDPKEEISNSEKVSKTEKKKTTAAFGFEKAKNGAQLIFVFDDGGQNLEQLKKFLALPFPITVAVLPQITHSVEAANLVRSSGNELILHQPMQSINANINPGPGAITPDMTDDQIVSQLFVNINQIAPIAGMNNHEGSGITADAEKMAVIMQMASDEGIYFLDSRTNVETKVPYVASELGYTYFERNIFLDNEKTRANALSELKKGLALANKNGSVIMIGHIWSADFLPQLLAEAYPELKDKGYTFSVVSTSKARKN
jgi:polysaccharide deacetylase 2 family uncharacterized protein YibQ